MAKLTYQRRSGGGSFKGRSIPSDKRATEAEQRIIDYLERTRSETSKVRSDFFKSTKGVMDAETDNRKTLQSLKTNLWTAKRDNVRIRRDTEVKRLESLAAQAGESAEFWQSYSGTLSENIKKAGQGLWDTISYHRDKAKAEEDDFPTDIFEDLPVPSPDEIPDEEDWPEPDPRDPGPTDKDGPTEGFPDPPDPDDIPPVEWPTPDTNPDTPASLALTANNSILNESQKEQIKLGLSGDFIAAERLKEQTWGRAANTTWWGTYYTREAASTFEQDWPNIVAFANEGVPPDKQGEDLIEASFFKWMRHKGIGVESIGGREVRKQFKRKLAALSTDKVQQQLVARDNRTTLDITNKLRAAIKSGNGVQEALNQLVIHEAHAHKSIKGKYSAPASRVINYGTTFDSVVESLMKIYPWASFDEFREAILSKKVLPLDKRFRDVPVNLDMLPTWEKQRANKISEYKDLFTKIRYEAIQNSKRNQAIDVQGRVAKLNLQLTDKTREDYIDKNTEDGRNKLWSMYDSAESKAEKDFIGEALRYDPKSHVKQIEHEAMMRALQQGDEAEFLWYYNNLDDYQKKYYDDMNRFHAYHELLKAGLTYEELAKDTDTLLKKATGFTVDSNQVSLRRAKEAAIQRFYDINASLDKDKFVNAQARKEEVYRRWNEEISDPNGLWATEQTNAGTEFKHFMPSPEYDDPDIYSGKILEGVNKNTTLEEINKMDLIPERARISLIKDIIKGEDSVRIPKILYSVSKNTGIPLIDLVNGQLQRENISTQYDFKATKDNLLKATQVEYLKAKAPEGSTVPKDIKPENIPAVLGFYDLMKHVGQGYPLPTLLRKYMENRNQSKLDSLDQAYQIIDGKTRFADAEAAIRSGQQQGVVYNPWTDNMVIT